MLTLNTSQASAVNDGYIERLGARYRTDLFHIAPAPVLADEAWPEWWRQTYEQGLQLGARDTQTLAIHTLLSFVLGPDYLRRDEMAWLNDLLTDDGVQPPDYGEIRTYVPDVLNMLDVLLIAD